MADGEISKQKSPFSKIYKSARTIWKDILLARA